MPVVHYRSMNIEDFDGLHELWRITPGVDITQADTPEGLAFFLERNPGLSFVAESGGQLVGGIMCGHDGRRGFIHHLVVYTPFRRQGIARNLVERSLFQLDLIGIEKCHLFIRRDNATGLKFWEGIGWKERLELTMASFSF
jgi:ribosomal protein S18 acetylase RimI-like enzyme